VESKPGYGTVVTAGFPLSPPPSREAHPPPQSNRSRGTERILVVDDEDQVRRLLVRGLQQGEYDVIEASGAQEAIAILEQENGEVQLVVTDVAMPVMNGVELADRVKARWPGLPVLFVSGHPYDVVALTQDVIAADRFLQKPFKLETLLSQVRAALDRVARS